jgi:DNA-binding CsgD family transcriptional regulator
MSKEPARPEKAYGYTAARPAAMALVIGLAALSASASESDLVRGIQRYCVACWRNAHLDPGLWDDCTQEVCCTLLSKAKSGQLDLLRVLSDDSQERRELVRAIDMVRKRVQRARKLEPLDERSCPAPDVRLPFPDQLALGELLHDARQAVLTSRQDRIVELWTHGHTVPDIAALLGLPTNRVSDEKYKALRKLERYLAQHDALDQRQADGSSHHQRQVG